jgi:hypothetical protein
MRRGRLKAALALSLLLALGAAVASDFVHTDDGCVVEQHCLACRWAQATLSLPALAPVPTMRLEPVGEVMMVVTAISTTVATAETASRAPPLA